MLKINNISKVPDDRTVASLTYKYTDPGDKKELITLDNMTSKGGVSANPTNDPNAGKLYNKLRAVIGDSVVLSSQTYRNSEYTVFIRMGSMGGNNAGAQDAVAVYGQWNGTNLTSTN